MKMTRRFYFLLLFIAATLTTALHEFSPLHEAEETCPVCIVDQHSVSSCVVTAVPAVRPVLQEAPFVLRKTPYAFSHRRLQSSRDPPFFI
jgi:hypothetical protein